MVLRVIEKITDDIIEQSKRTRYEYLERIERDFADMQKGSPLGKQVQRDRVMSPAARAHATWQWPDEERKLINMPAVNIGVISSHNGVLSSLENFERDPYIIEATAKQLAAERGFRIKSQIVGRMPNMCDGNTQGRRGMALSVYSRETGAEAFDEGDGHDITNRTVVLTACDKSVPASLEGAGDSGHKPTIWIPAGTMNDGIPDIEKQKVREAFARGELGYDEWQVSENEAYKGGGICQFLGTAATGEFVKLALGLGLPGTGYIFASSREVHDAIVWESVKQLVDLDMPVGRMIDERSIVNATVTCLAIGGSTNYAIHMIAIAKSFGIVLTPENIAELSDNVVQILSVYPNQKKFNINAIPLSGGEGYAFRTLIDNGYIDPETNTVRGRFGDHYTQQAVFTKRKTPKNQFPTIDNVPININTDVWYDVGYQDGPEKSLNLSVMRSANKDGPVEERPFRNNGGWKLLKGQIGNLKIDYAWMKTSAVEQSKLVTEGPAIVFDTIEAFEKAKADGDLTKAAHESAARGEGLIIVLRFYGPINGMPESHGIMPTLANLQDICPTALLADGRLSGASGKIPSAIHAEPEAALGGLLARLRTNDRIRIDGNTGDIDFPEINDSPEKIKAFCKRPNAPFVDNFPPAWRHRFHERRMTIAPASQGCKLPLGEFAPTQIY